MVQRKEYKLNIPCLLTGHNKVHHNDINVLS